MTPPRRGDPLAILALGLLLVPAPGCAKPPPDVGPTRAVAADDTSVVVLLHDVDRVGVRDGRAAARMLRDDVLPRARRNATAAAGLQPSHPRAQRLADELASLLSRRVTLLEDYATALERDDTEALLRVVRAQRQLEDQLGALDRRLSAAAEPRSAGGGGVP